MSDHNRRADDTWVSKISSLWPILMAIITIIILGTSLKNKVDEHEFRISKLETSIINIQFNAQRLVDELLDKKFKR